MCTAGDDGAVVNEDDLIGVLEHERRGGHDDRRAPLAGAGELRGDACLGVGIDGGGGLDEHGNLRLG